MPKTLELTPLPTEHSSPIVFYHLTLVGFYFFDEIKVSEFIQLDEQFEFGIGIEAALYVPTLEDDVIENFIQNFNNGTFKADETMYSFKNEEN